MFVAETMEVFHASIRMKTRVEQSIDRRTFSIGMKNIAVDQIELILQFNQDEIEVDRQTKGDFMLKECQFLDHDRPSVVGAEEIRQ